MSGLEAFLFYQLDEVLTEMLCELWEWIADKLHDVFS